MNSKYGNNYKYIRRPLQLWNFAVVFIPTNPSTSQKQNRTVQERGICMFPASLPAAMYLVWTWRRRKDFPLPDSNLQIRSRFFSIMSEYPLICIDPQVKSKYTSVLKCLNYRTAMQLIKQFIWFYLYSYLNGRKVECRTNVPENSQVIQGCW